MTSRRLLAPGGTIADLLCSDRVLLERMLDVELAWCRVLHGAGRIDGESLQHVERAVRALQRQTGLVDTLAAEAGAGGNPVIPLVAALRREIEQMSPDAAWLVHRGLTSQDTLDTALMLMARDVLDVVSERLHESVSAVARLADEHRDTLMIGRTLTQQATPTTFGLRAASWLQSLAGAGARIDQVRGRLPVQCGGAVGNLAAVAEVVPDADPLELSHALATELGLEPALPWHVRRTAVTDLADALATVTDAYGHLAGDVVTLCRTEIGELSEPAKQGRGSSSTLPDKRNPVLSIEIRQSALGAPHDLAAVHLASVLAVDDRPDGAWHSEWQPLCRLLGAAAITATLGAELLPGLEVHREVMRAHVDDALPGALAEQAAMHRAVEPEGHADPTTYLGATHQMIDRALDAVREDEC